MDEHAQPQPLHRSLAWRTTTAILVFSALVGAIAAVACILYLQRAEQHRLDQHLRQLIETVKRTANIAAFTSDRAVAAEVAAGMLANQFVARVAIRTDQSVLVDTGYAEAHGEVLTESLVSPFDSSEVVGNITLVSNGAEIRRQSAQWSQVIALMLGLVVAAVAFAVAAIVQTTITTPIRRIAERLRTMDPLSGSSLPTPVRDEHNELGQLVVAFNGLVERVASQATELRRHGEHLQDMVAERTRDLLEAKEAAENANRAKSEFLSNMSHELRTPMHAILSFARLGVERSERGSPQKMKHYFSTVVTSGERLLVLLNNLLDLSKLEAGMMDISLSPRDLGMALQEAVREFAPLAGEKQITIRFDNHTDDRPVHYDPIKVHQVLTNLLSNAIKFSPAGGYVDVRLSDGELYPYDSVDGPVSARVISISDQGVGIPESELETVFDKFVQSSKTRSGAGGTGLGLSIVREIVKLHGGTVHARNNPAGGACVIVALPFISVEKVTASPRARVTHA